VNALMSLAFMSLRSIRRLLAVSDFQLRMADRIAIAATSNESEQECESHFRK
jgi:hypothetical protein